MNKNTESSELLDVPQLNPLYEDSETIWKDILDSSVIALPKDTEMPKGCLIPTNTFRMWRR